MNIVDKLGDNYYDMELKDDESLIGGKSYIDETLGEFMLDVGIVKNDSYKLLCETMKKCGVKL